MHNNNSTLEQVLDLKKWQVLQNALSKSTNMAIIMVDYRGIPVTTHSNCQTFCDLVRQDPDLLPFCEKCDARGGLEAVRLNQPYMYLCHFGIVDIAIPILVNGQYVGAIMAGQFKLADAKETPLEQIVARPKGLTPKLQYAALKEHYETIPKISLADAETAADMLFHLASYIVTEAMEKNFMIQSYQNALLIQNNDTSLVDYNQVTDHLQQIRSDLSQTLLDHHINQQVDDYQPKHSVLQPAFQLMREHKQQQYQLNELADACHLSPSYFSRLFAKETGENFAGYYAQMKIQWAKELLLTSDFTINEISESLGFNETGYFIRVFKKYEGITPARYRKITK